MTRKHARIGVLLLMLPLTALVGRVEGSSPVRENQPYLKRSTGQATGAECGGDLRPDRAVIVGGITAESLKPSEASAQLEKQLAEVEKYVDEQGGTLKFGERIRAVRGASRSSRDRGSDELPFVTVQRLEVEFPIDIDVDEILDRLLQFGLDKFGKNVRIESRDRNPKVVVRYRFSNLREGLEQLHRQCKAKAVEEWCTMTTPVGEREVCTRALGKLRHHLVTRSFTLQSQPILHERGRFAPIRLSYPWQEGQLAVVELIGDVVLRFHGTISVVLPGTWRR